MPNELKDLLNAVQVKTRKTLEEIAKEIKYSPSYVRAAKGRKGNKKLVAIIRDHYADALGTSKRTEAAAEPKKLLVEVGADTVTYELTQRKAMLKALWQQTAKIMSRLYNRPVADCLEELEQNTSLILKELADQAES